MPFGVSSDPPLTDRNGVICRRCYRTIDLTKLSLHKRPSNTAKSVLSSLVTPTNTTNITCPFCNQTAHYYRRDVRPLASTWEEEKQIYEARILALNAEVAFHKGNAKQIAAAYVKETEDEPESSGSTPPNSNAPQEPSPPKREKTSGVY